MNTKFRKTFLLYVCIIMFILSLAYILYNNYTIYKEEHQLKELKNRKNADIVISENDTRYTNIVAKDININSPIFSLVKQILFINSAVAESETEMNNVITVLSSIEQNNGLPQATIEVQPEILPEYKSLYEENNDFFAWIRIEDTTIDYPVMHTPDYEDINFYLNKDWNKKKSKLGSIFIDGRCKKDSNNLIIYGHNIKGSDSMFGALTKYKRESYYAQHRFIKFDTLYEKDIYEIVAVSKAIAYYEDIPKDKYIFYAHTEFKDQKEFEDYMVYMKENSFYDIDVNAEYGDKLITLVTCDYWTKNARLVIVAKKL